MSNEINDNDIVIPEKPQFPPTIKPEDLLPKNSSSSGKPSRIPNAFIAYRIAFCQGLKSQNICITMPDVSSLASDYWAHEPIYVKAAYKRIANEAKLLYDEQSSSNKVESKEEKSKSENTNQMMEPTATIATTTITTMILENGLAPPSPPNSTVYHSQRGEEDYQNYAYYSYPYYNNSNNSNDNGYSYDCYYYNNNYNNNYDNNVHYNNNHNDNNNNTNDNNYNNNSNNNNNDSDYHELNDYNGYGYSMIYDNFYQVQQIQRSEFHDTLVPTDLNYWSHSEPNLLLS